MFDYNQTRVTEFQLLGFPNLYKLRFLLFMLLLAIYITTLTGNLVIITMVSTNHNLQSPMYFFLSHLSSTEIMSTTNIIPKMLQVLLLEASTLSFTECMTQFYFFSALTNTECFLLAVMSYDRYLAICNPLRYTSIMNFKLCLYLVFLSWFSGLFVTLIITNLISKLHFCGPNIIDHFFCDLFPLLKLSCSDTFMVEIQASVFSVPVIVIPFIFITASYIIIYLAIIKISSLERQKAFSTCSSHLVVVCTYYGTLISVYLVPSKGDSVNIKKVLSLLYIVVTPLLNPIIYSLRNKEIKLAIVKCFFKGQ